VPETRLERVIFALGLCAAAAIAALIVFNRSDVPEARPPAVEAAPARPAAEVTTVPAEAAREPTAVQRQTPRPRPASGVRLQLTASRGDSWVELRSGSAQGDVLFSGIVAQGETRSFSAPRLYARFGNAASLDARLNGRTFELRPGTYSALVTSRGLADVTLG
jgi:hypothetical protein